MADTGREVDLLAGLKRIGIDEISRRKGQRYITVVIDHDSGRLVWAARGRDRKTVERFFDQLGEERCKHVELVSADMASWIAGPVAERCPNATLCVDAFHVVQAATDALDEVRREVWNDARQAGHDQLARQLKGARFALWKNPENLTGRQQTKLAAIQQLNRRLYRAYLLKEQLRQIYRCPPPRPSPCSTGGSPGRDAAACPPSPDWPRRSPPNGPGSSPRSSTACPTPASKPPTPPSASSPAAPSAFTAPKPSSP